MFTLTKRTYANRVRVDIRTSVLALWGALFLFHSACAKTQQTGPTIHSSASSVSYATEYPSRLEALGTQFTEATAMARENWSRFDGFTGELAEPRWDQVKTVYEKAQMAGQSQAVVEWMRQGATVRQFVEDNDASLSQRIGARVNAQIEKEKGAAVGEFDSRPSVRWALEDATDKVIEERYRELNEAHCFLAANSGSLEKKNVKALEKQVDTITETSFVVHVLLIDLKQQMQAKVEEADRIKETLDSEINRQRLIAEADESSKNDRAAATQKVQELSKIKGSIDAYAKSAGQTVDDFEQRLEQFQKEYREAFGKLIAAVEQKEAEQKGTSP